MSSRNSARYPFQTVKLYQIGIRCLAATHFVKYFVLLKLYQIGIRCLAATGKQSVVRASYYIKLELDV